MKSFNLKRVDKLIEDELQHELQRSRVAYSDTELLLTSVLATHQVFDDYNQDIFKKFDIQDIEFNILMLLNDHQITHGNKGQTKQDIVDKLSVKRTQGYKILESLSTNDKNKYWLTIQKNKDDLRSQLISLNERGKEKYETVAHVFFLEHMKDLLADTNEVDVKDIETTLLVLKKMRESMLRSKQAKNSATTAREIEEFFGIVYSPSLKIMALTTKKTFRDFTEKQLVNNYLQWNQARGHNPLFLELAEATDRKAILMIEQTKDDIANKVIEFIKQGYLTGSQLKPYIKDKL